MKNINLDYASHTPMDERVLAEYCRIERGFAGNVMAANTIGRESRTEMERATNGIANLLGISPQEIIYTSGTSEANNLAIKGIAKAYGHVGRHILSTCLEHPSVSGTLAALVGYEIELLRVLPSGAVDLAHLKSAIRADTVLVCVSAVDSELGVLQPLEGIAEIVKAFPNCHLHIDAAQAVGKISINVGALMKTASTLCFSPHKFYGPNGVGVLAKREGVVLEPIIHGGSSLSIYRGGTPVLSLAVAAYAALEIAVAEMATRLDIVRELRDYVLHAINDENLMRCGIRINTPIENASPYILNLSAVGITGAEMQAELDRRGICVSVKSACSTDRAPSRAVLAVTGNKKNARESFRVSFCHLTSKHEVKAFISALGDII